jgi:hypothetical protein
VAIDATVQKTKDRQIRLSGRYCARSEIAADDSAVLEHAFNDAYRQALVALAIDIARRASTSEPQAASC